MPRMDVVERDYAKAIEIVKEEYPNVPVGSPEFWSLVFGVVKRMRGRKSARQLQYLGVLSKAEDFDSLFYLPYMFQQKVSGVDLLMDLPEPPGKVPPSALPSFPAAISRFVDTLRVHMRRAGWGEREFAERVVETYLTLPIIVELDDNGMQELLERGSAPLNAISHNNITEDDVLGWKLIWVYAMLAKRIQPLTPRWGYRLAQVTRDVRDVALRRIAEHFSTTRLRNPFDVYNQVHQFDLPFDNGVVLNGHALVETVKAMVRSSEWRAETVESYWIAIRSILSAILPAWVAYALHTVNAVDVRKVKFLFRDTIQANEVLCAFVREKFLTTPSRAPFAVLPKPASKEEMQQQLRRIAERDDTMRDLKDEIVATLTKRWLV